MSTCTAPILVGCGPWIVRALRLRITADAELSQERSPPTRHRSSPSLPFGVVLPALLRALRRQRRTSAVDIFKGSRLRDGDLLGLLLFPDEQIAQSPVANWSDKDRL